MGSARTVLDTASVFRRAVKNSPAILLFVQTPLALSELAQDLLGINDSVQPSPAAIAVVLPILFMLSFLASALSFTVVEQLDQTGQCNLNAAGNRVYSHRFRLLVASLALGCLSGIGLVAYVIPGLILMTLFLFVPHLIIADSPTTLSVSVTRSKKLAFKFAPLSFFIVFVSFGLSLVTFLLGEHLGTYFGAAGSDDFTRRLVLFATRAGFAMIGGGFVDVWVASYFLTLRRQP